MIKSLLKTNTNLNQMCIVQRELVHQEYRLNGKLRLGDRVYAVDMLAEHMEYIDRCNSLNSEMKQH